MFESYSFFGLTLFSDLLFFLIVDFLGEDLFLADLFLGFGFSVLVTEPALLLFDGDVTFTGVVEEVIFGVIAFLVACLVTGVEVDAVV